jgi:putative ABC transport system ATP-binding protein
MLLRLDGVCREYGPSGGGAAVRALDGVSLELAAGMVLCVRGPSGCGKTTLLLTAGTLLAPTAGSVTLGGTEPYRLSPDARAAFRGRHVGFVFQQFHLVPYLTVRDNVLAPTLAAGSLTPEAARGRAEELLAEFGLTERADHTPHALSSGERQRCALARALFNRPRLLLADEPTGNLDPDNAATVLAALRRFAADGGGVLLVTHDDTAAAAADRIIWMRAGRFS